MQKKLTGECAHCGSLIKYPAEAIGSTVSCPFCKKPTELTLSTPEVESGVPKRAIWLAVIALVILLLGLFGMSQALKRARRIAGEQPIPASQMHNRAP